MSQVTDDKIRVATVDSDGTLCVWDRPDERGVRKKLSQTKYPNKGIALQYASEFETNEREAAKRRAR